mgnify:FL=1|tara:strand:+ start:502 stop:1047 length:546 start_codon:yes stop_codon:yes gene_type:complete
MGTVFVDNLEPQSGTSLTLGASGDTVSLGSGGTVTNVPAFAAKMSGTQQLANDTTTKIAYDTEVYDTDSAYDHSSNYRFTVPSNKGGKYFIGASVRSGNMADTKKINMYLHVNGSEVAEHFAQVVSSNTNEQYTVGVFKVLNLSASDYVEVFVLHQNGAAVNFSSSSSIGSFFYGYRLIGA